MMAVCTTLQGDDSWVDRPIFGRIKLKDDSFESEWRVDHFLTRDSLSGSDWMARDLISASSDMP